MKELVAALVMGALAPSAFGLETIETARFKQWRYMAFAHELTKETSCVILSEDLSPDRFLYLYFELYYDGAVSDSGEKVRMDARIDGNFVENAERLILEIDNKAFEIEGNVFAGTQKSSFVEAAKAGNRMRIRAFAWNGSTQDYETSLSGFTAAWERLLKSPCAQGEEGTNRPTPPE